MSRWGLSWFLVLAATILVTWRAAESEPVEGEEAKLYRLFVDALEHVDRSYVKEVDRRELIESAIVGMLEELDPYSTFIPPKELEQFSRSTKGSFGGVGIQVRPKPKHEPFLEVLSPVVGTPAYEAGVLAEDRIVSVDGVPVEGLTQSEVVEKLTGEPGTPVKISVLHAPFDQPAVDITLNRALINIESVLGDGHKPDNTWQYLVDDKEKIAYIRVTSFMEKTAGELRKVLEELQKEGIRGLVIDLRDNPGGLLTSAIEVCDLFLKEGTIVSTKGRNTQDKAYTASGEALLEGVPLAILVNRWSASASEIVSACLQDHDRATIVGERSFGKGSVQNVIELDDGLSALKLTTASYQRPSGKNIHRFKDSKDEDDWGVRPNEGYLVPFSDDEHRQYMEWRHGRDRIIGKGHPATAVASAANPPAEPAAEPKEGEKKDEEKKEEEKKDVAPVPFGDKQLDKALEFIRVKLAGEGVKPA